jgi:fructose-bisphosphate aldolase class 1
MQYSKALIHQALPWQLNYSYESARKSSLKTQKKTNSNVKAKAAKDEPDVGCSEDIAPALMATRIE